MLVDLHVHSCYSKDSLSTPAEIVARMRALGLGALAVTDHDAIDGALEAARLAPGAIIVGEEVRTAEGEIIGLYLRDLVPPGLTPEETVERIHAQGGLVYVPHPCDHARGSTLIEEAFRRIAGQVDLLEVYNARVGYEALNRQARVLAQRHYLAAGAGSDAHRVQDIGLAAVEIRAFSDATSFLAALRQGTVHGRLTGPVGRLSATHARLVKRWRHVFRR